MTTDQLTYAGSLVLHLCWCGIRYAVPSELDYSFERGDHREMFCPLGHSGIKSGPNLKQQLVQEREQAQTRERALLDQLDAAERTRTALKGHLTRMRNRIAAGVCPWCKRSFHQVERHVRSQHPERVEQMKEALGP